MRKILFLFIFLVMSIVSATDGLGVLSVTPTADNWQVDANNAQIAVAFDRPIVPLVAPTEQDNLIVPFSISPRVDGEGMWVTTSLYVFTPDEALSGGTEYTITIEKGLEATDGSELLEDYTWSFRTLNPQTISVTATDMFDDRYVLLDSGFTVEFSQAMDKASTEAAFELRNYGNDPRSTYDANYGNAVVGTFDWNDDNTEFTFTPDEPLGIHDYLHLYVATTALSESGFASLEHPITHEFRTVSIPVIGGTYPSDRQTVAAGTTTFNIRFNTAIDTNTIQDRFVISPQPIGEITPIANDTSFSLQFETEPDVTYTVTILAGIEDIYRNSIDTDYVTTFSTRFVEPKSDDFIRFKRLPYRFTIAGTYLDVPQIEIEHAGDISATFRIYKIPYAEMPEDLPLYWYHSGGFYSEYDSQKGEYIKTPPPYAHPENILHEWTVEFNETTDTILDLTLSDGSPLPMGLYGIELDAPELEALDGFVLSVGNTGITLKRGPGDTVIWLTDYETGQPVANAEVTVYDGGDGTSLGVSDEFGLVTMPEAMQYISGYDLIVADGEGVYGAWIAGRTANMPADSDSYIYTDRPVYRQGETVYFRGVFRDRDDTTLTIPDLDTAYVSVGDPYSDGDPIYTAELSLSEMGTFNGEFVLPEEVSLYPQIYVSDCLFDDTDCRPVYSARINFEVAEFRVPEFEVTVTAEESEIIAGEPINALVSANYYFGGAVNDAHVEWSATSGYSPRFYYQGGEKGYRFGTYNRWGGVSEYGGGNTDNAGRYLITDAIRPGIFAPKNVTIEGIIRDETGTPIAGRTSVLVHPANVYIGMRSGSRFVSVNEPFTLDLLSVHPDSTIRPNQSIDITITEIQWVNTSEDYGVYQWERQENEFDTLSVQTNAEGYEQFSFTPPSARMYRIDADAVDENGRQARTTITVYAQETTRSNQRVWFDSVYQYYTCGYTPEYNRLRLTPDQDNYAPGDTARVFIPNPFGVSARALITVERADVMQQEVVIIEGDALTYDVPLTTDFAPNAHINVTLMTGIDEENPAPRTIRGDVNVTVDPVHKRLNVELTASQGFVEPGEEVEFTVHVTDFEDRPVQGEVGLALTDEAVLALRPPNSGTLEDAFYPYMGLSISTYNSIWALLSVPTNAMESGCGGGGGGGGFAQSMVRDDFIYTPLWEPNVVTDENGMATVSVTMPDNLTRWRLDARAVTDDTSIGQNTLNITSTLPLIVRPVAPRFFIMGDHAEVGAVINNQTDEEQIVTVLLEIDGATVTGDLTQTVTIAGGERARVVWLADINSLDGVDFTVYASSNEFQDAAKPSLTNTDGVIPVYRFVAEDVVATSGILDEGEGETKTEAISLSERYSDIQGELTIQLDASLAEITLDSLWYLDNLSYQCYEYKVSRFLPHVVADRVLTRFNINDEGLKNDLSLTIDKNIATLQEDQNRDGGWGWFGGMRSSPYVTAYVLLGLVEANDSGYAVSVNVSDRAVSYLERYLLEDVDFNTSDWRLNQQAFMLYVLSKAHQAPDRYIEYLDDLFAERVQMSLTGRAYLLMAYNQRNPGNPAIDALADDLLSNAIVSATGTHWEDRIYDYRTWNSNIRSNAVILTALIQSRPDNPLLPNVIRWLVTARKGDSWETTQEIVWASMALTEWMSASGDLITNYSYEIDLNDTMLLDANMSNPMDSNSVVVDVADLHIGQTDNLNITRSAGKGTLYYNAALNLQLPANEVPAISRDMIVEKQIFTTGDAPTAVTSSTVGDVMIVRVTVTVTEDIYFFALEDMLPAGLEVINPRLLTESQNQTRPTIEMEYSGQFWSWATWYFDRIELGDRGAEIYADYLPRGTYVFSYQARTVTSGEFQMIPTRAYAMYQSEVYGRTSGSLFTVVGE